MFNIGGGEILVIALIALIAVGPEQLPSVMRKVGGFVNQVRTMTTGIRDEFMSAVDEADPNKWMGDGSSDEPIVPRGYAENAVKSSADPSAEAVAKATQQTSESADGGGKSEDSASDSSVSEGSASEDPESSDSGPTNKIAAMNARSAKEPVPTEAEADTDSDVASPEITESDDETGDTA